MILLSQSKPRKTVPSGKRWQWNIPYVPVGNTSSKCPFSIAMLVYASVFVLFLGFPKIVVPQTEWFIIETPIKMHDLGGKTHYFRKPPYRSNVSTFPTLHLLMISSQPGCEVETVRDMGSHGGFQTLSPSHGPVFMTGKGDGFWLGR